MILNEAKERAAQWQHTLIKARKKSNDICKITGFSASKVSVLLNAKPDDIAKMRLCDFCAIEGAMTQIKNECEIFKLMREISLS